MANNHFHQEINAIVETPLHNLFHNANPVAQHNNAAHMIWKPRIRRICCIKMQFRCTRFAQLQYGFVFFSCDILGRLGKKLHQLIAIELETCEHAVVTITFASLHTTPFLLGHQTHCFNIKSASDATITTWELCAL